MFRRWFIRSLFLLPVLLCMVGWVWSTTRLGEVSYARTGHWVVCGTYQGMVNVRGGRNRDWGDGWNVVLLGGSSPARYLPAPDPRFPAFLGFSLREFRAPSSAGPVQVREVYVPYWFLLFVFSLTLLLVWRRTAPRKPGGAFPVEMTTKQRANNGGGS